MASSWTPEDVCLWVQALGLNEFADAFRQEEVDGEILFDLDKEGCAELGVTGTAAEQLLTAIKRLKAGDGDGSPSPSPQSSHSEAGQVITSNTSAAEADPHTPPGFSPTSPPIAGGAQAEAQFERNLQSTRDSKSTWGRIRAATVSRSSGKKLKKASSSASASSTPRAKSGTVGRSSAAQMRKAMAQQQRAEDQQEASAHLDTKQQNMLRSTMSRAQGQELTQAQKLQQAAGKMDKNQLQMMMFMMALGFNRRQEVGHSRSKGESVGNTHKARLPGFQTYTKYSTSSRGAIPDFHDPAEPPVDPLHASSTNTSVTATTTPSITPAVSNAPAAAASDGTISGSRKEKEKKGLFGTFRRRKKKS